MVARGGDGGGRGKTEGPNRVQLAAQWGLGRKPSTAMLRVALGMRTTKPSRSLEAMIWQPRRDLQAGGRRGGAVCRRGDGWVVMVVGRVLPPGRGGGG